MTERTFRELFDEAYSSSKAEKVARPAQRFRESVATDAARALGHPDFEFLQIGQTFESKALVFFLDIRGFTKLCFVYSNDELVRILQALAGASVTSIAQFGGHIIEFTGDGVMAVFGDSRRSAEEVCLAGLHCTSFLMRGIREGVNPRLKAAGTDPIRIAVGMEFGDVLWSRIGVLSASQVKPISEVSFLAGKLSTKAYTDAWEAKVGENLAAWIPEDFREKVERYEFVLDNKTYAHDLFLFRWKQFGEEYQRNAQQLQKLLLERKLGTAVLTAGRVTTPDSSTRSGARPLKDQPFF